MTHISKYTGPCQYKRMTCKDPLIGPNCLAGSNIENDIPIPNEFEVGWSVNIEDALSEDWYHFSTYIIFTVCL